MSLYGPSKKVYDVRDKLGNVEDQETTSSTRNVEAAFTRLSFL